MSSITINALGTSNQTFQIGKQGPVVKHNNGILEFRNSNDTAFISIKGSSEPPESNNSLVTKQYVDSVATGLNVKNSCRVTTTSSAELTGFTYNVGNEPTGLVWTNVTSPVFDGVTILNGDRVLIKDASDPKGNGIFTYSSQDSAFIRAQDADNTPHHEVTNGLFCLIIEGDQNTASGWVLTEPDGIAELGVDNLIFTQFSSTGAGLISIEQDISPTLGGNLNTNTYKITSQGSDNLILETDTGNIILNSLTWPTSDGSENHYLKTNGLGALSFAQINGSEINNNQSWISQINQDTSPSLGGNLDVSTFSIISTSTNNIVLAPQGTGYVVAFNGYNENNAPGFAFTTKDYVISKENSLLLEISNHTVEDLVGQTHYTTIIKGTEVENAVNYIDITNAITGETPSIKSEGTDDDIDLYISPKGTGKISVGSYGNILIQAVDDTSFKLKSGNGTVDGADLVIEGGNGDVDSGGVIIRPGTSGMGEAGHIFIQAEDEKPVVQFIGTANIDADSWIVFQNGELEGIISVDSEEANADLRFSPKGDGQIFIGGTSDGLIQSENDTTLVLKGGEGTTNGMHLILEGGDGDIDGGSVILRPGDKGTGDAGYVIIQAEDEKYVAQFIGTSDINADSWIVFQNGQEKAIISVDGEGDDKDLVLTPKGAGRIIVGDELNNAFITSKDAQDNNTNGYDLELSTGVGLGTGNGGNIVLEPGAGGTTGRHGAIQLEGAVKHTTRIISINNNTASTDYTVFVNTTQATGHVTLTIRTIDTYIGRVIVVKDRQGNAATNNIIIATEGSQTIDGTSTRTISTNYGSLTLQSDGTNWLII